MLGEIIGALYDCDNPAVPTPRHGMPGQLVAAAIQICEDNRFQSVITPPGWLLLGVGRCLSHFPPGSGPLSSVAVKRTGDHGAMAIPPSGPFVPGAGHVPPHLAGRESEQGFIVRLLEALSRRRATASDLILYGPRGNGKTVLLEWMLREARARGLTTIDFSSVEIESTKWLARELSALSTWTRILSEVSAFGLRLKAASEPSVRISRALEAKARKRPLVVAVDEAHSLGVDPGKALLHSVQLVRRKELPIILALAGTPELPRRLNSMESTFWDRSEVLRIGLLNRTAAADAIRIPFEKYGRSIDPLALAEVVKESHGYPYFLQLWGMLLWQAESRPTHRVTMDAVAHARAGFETRRNRYYGNRYDELVRARLNSVAAKLALFFQDGGHRTFNEIHQVVTDALVSEGRDAGGGGTLRVVERLHDLGFIWTETDGGTQHYVPGIPSLLAFVARTEGLGSGENSS